VPTLLDLRRYALERSLFRPTTLGRAIARLGFVQADPIRAPARAQDLTLRHRVNNYRAGDLEKHYPKLPIEEDFFVNYGFLPRATQALMHPRTPSLPLTALEKTQAPALLDFVRDKGAAHPREVDAHFAHGKATNWFGGQSNVTTKLLDKLHFHGQLRVTRRDAGTRVYAVQGAVSEFGLTHNLNIDPSVDPHAALDGLIDVIVHKYAPLPAASLGQLVTYLMRGVPQHKPQRNAALQRAKARLANAKVDGVDWYWPANEKLGKTKDAASTEEVARLLAPFDPIVWDRRRFSLFWGWDYRFEAYTPAPKRKLGYYALPLLWRGEVIGWGNAAVADAALQVSIGLVGKHRVSADLKRALDAEVDSMALFLGAQQASWSLLSP
jgi:uncharacterized protein YcaQ